jgi:hypothetical protein
MADVIKNSYDEENRFEKVIFQRGRDVLDFELNEFQDIIRVQQLRALYAGIQEAKGVAALNPGSNDNGFLLTGTGAVNEVSVGTGILICDGIPIRSFTAGTVTGFTTNVSGSDRYDVVYLQVTETEVADPAQMPQLGETTLRRQLSVTYGITTGVSLVAALAAMPANTVAEIWEGGTRYFAIGYALRANGVPAIASNTVFDLRYLLPPSVIAQITRQSNGAVQALVATDIETPDGVLLPKSSTLSFDVDPDNSFPAAIRTVQARARRDGTSFTMFQALYGPGGVFDPHLNGHFALGLNTALYNPNTLMFYDGLMETAGTGGQENVPLADTTNRYPRIPGLEVGHYDAGGVYAGRISLMKAINGRITVTVGDGVDTFGDFNGVDALQQVMAAFSSLPSPVVVLKIQVKAGAYTISDASPLTVPSTVDSLEIEGVSRTDCVINVSKTTGAAISTPSSQFSMTLRGLAFVVSTTIPITTMRGPLRVDDVYTSGGSFALQGSYLGPVVLGSPYSVHITNSSLSGNSAFAVVHVDLTGTSTVPAVMVENSDITCGTGRTALAIVCSDTSTCVMRGGTFSGCRIQLSASAITGAAFTTDQAGVLHLSPGNSLGVTTMGAVLFENCDVTGSSHATNANVFFYVRPMTDGTKRFASVESITVRGGTWYMPSGPQTTIPIYIGDATQDLAESTGGLAHVVQRVEFVDTFFGYTGDSATATQGTLAPTETGYISLGAITVTAMEFVVRNVSVTGFVPRGTMSDMLLDFCPMVDIDGLRFTNYVDGPAAGTIPALGRIILNMPDSWSVAGENTHSYTRRVANLVINGRGATRQMTDANGAVFYAVPNGNLSLEKCIINKVGGAGAGNGDFVVYLQSSDADGERMSGLTMEGCQIIGCTQDYGFYLVALANTVTNTRPLCRNLRLIDNIIECDGTGILIAGDGAGTPATDAAEWEGLVVSGNTTRICVNSFEFAPDLPADTNPWRIENNTFETEAVIGKSTVLGAAFRGSYIGNVSGPGYGLTVKRYGAAVGILSGIRGINTGWTTAAPPVITLTYITTNEMVYNAGVLTHIP